jgi:hypothetical protein
MVVVENNDKTKNIFNQATYEWRKSENQEIRLESLYPLVLDLLLPRRFVE